MRLRVIGSNGTYPTAGRPTSGYLVETGASTLLLDAGQGVAMAMSDLIDPADLTAVVISHAHPDHCGDLFALLNVLRFGGSGRSGLPVFGPADVFEKVADFLDAAGGHAMFDAFDLRPIAGGDHIDVGPFGIDFGDAVHPVPAVVTRVTCGQSVMTYSGDTGPESDLVDIARDSDLLLCEASLQGQTGVGRYPYHLYAAEAGEIAESASVRHLVLTHLVPTLAPETSAVEARARFSGPVSVAHPGFACDVR
ncbi:MBL fold metallo-hydrolase [bacterium]|nr:MBL fold metallo-hydrolase [bacterium]